MEFVPDPLTGCAAIGRAEQARRCPKRYLEEQMVKLRSGENQNRSDQLTKLEPSLLGCVNRHLQRCISPPTRIRPHPDGRHIAKQTPSTYTLKLACASPAFRNSRLELRLTARVPCQYLMPLALTYNVLQVRPQRNLTQNELRRISQGCPCLETLDMSYCILLESLTGLEKHPTLSSVIIHKCSGITCIKAIEKMACLTSLDASECSKLKDLNPVANCPTLRVLRLEGRSDLSCLKTIVESKGARLMLSLNRNRDFSVVETLTSAPRVERISLNNCTDLKSLEPIKCFEDVESIGLSYCTTLSNLDQITQFKGLSTLNLSLCGNLREIGPLQASISLVELNLSECSNMGSIEALRPLASLRRLNLARCSNLHDCSSVGALHCLEWVDVSSCHHLREFVGFEECAKLREIQSAYNYNLEDIACLGASTSLKVLEFSNCLKLIRLPECADMNLEYLSLAGDIALQVVAWCLDIFDCVVVSELATSHVEQDFESAQTDRLH